MSKNSDDEYVSADENTTDDDKLLRLEDPDASQQGVTEQSDLQTVNKCTNGASNISAQEQQPEVVKVLDNKYVTDAESVKSGGVVELTEEQRKVSSMYILVLLSQSVVMLTIKGIVVYIVGQSLYGVPVE